MRNLFFALCAFGLVSCGPETSAVVEVETSFDRSVTRAAPRMAGVDQIVVTGSKVGSDLDDIGADDSSAQYLAYAYRAELRLPASEVGDVLRKHEALCFEAGPQVCRVLRSTVREVNADNVLGDLEFSATRAFMAPFREGLASEAEAVDGRLVSMSAEVEDLSRQIVDTSARLEAQMTLRDRLIVLLEKDTDDIGDLLKVEEQLASVQSEIESIESYLRVLEGRVKMDRISINYQSIRKPVTSSTGQPLQEAFSEFFYVVSASLAQMVLFVAAALPWLILIVPGLILLRLFIRSLRRAR